MNEILGDWRAFLARLFEHLAEARIDVTAYELDHVCFRTDTLATYGEKKAELERVGRLLTEADVNGRPIATYFLREPLRHEARSIHLVELPAPKASKPTPAGLEHAEFVVGPGLASFAARHSHLRFDLGGMRKPRNPELELSFGAMAAKFHPTSLLEVIQSERAEAFAAKFAMRTPQGDTVTNRLAVYQPTLAGTFPLGLEVPGSDLDFLCFARDLEAFTRDARAAFGSCALFRESSGHSRGDPYVGIAFELDGVPVELFAQNLPPRRQAGFRHMEVEAKLLAYAGAWSVAELRARKLAGAKTEPAFADFFVISDLCRESDDAYEAMLRLAEAPDAELRVLAMRRLML